MNVRKEGKTMEKVSMNKLEMARRAAKGGSGGTIPPATSETLGGVKIGAGVNVSEDGTISVSSYAPHAYSTNEVATGRKWIDGKDIYEKTYYYENGIALTAAGADTGIPHTNFDKIINCRGVGGNCQFVSGNTFYSSTNIRVSVHEPLTVSYIIFEYTKPTV